MQRFGVDCIGELCETLWLRRLPTYCILRLSTNNKPHTQASKIAVLVGVSYRDRQDHQGTYVFWLYVCLGAGSSQLRDLLIGIAFGLFL